MSIKEYNITHTQMGGGELKEDVGGGSAALAPATANTLGGVKIGNGISVTEDGTISAAGGGTERPVITLMGNEGTTDGHGTRTIPINIADYGLTSESPMPIINMLGAGSLIPTDGKVDAGDDELTPYVQYSNFSRATATDSDTTHIYGWTDYEVSQSDGFPGVVLDKAETFYVKIKTIAYVSHED